MTHQAQTAGQMKIRLPLALKAELARQADINERSMNAEIVYRLRQAFDTKQTQESKHAQAA